DNARTWPPAHLLRLVRMREQHSRRAIGDLAGIAGVMDTIFSERRLERCQRLRRRARPDALVEVDRGVIPLLAAVGILGLLLAGHGDHLALESPVLLRPGGLLLAFRPKFVGLFAVDAPLVRDALGREPLRR